MVGNVSVVCLQFSLIISKVFKVFYLIQKFMLIHNFAKPKLGDSQRSLSHFTFGLENRKLV